MANITENMNLSIIDPSDFVDPTPINDNFKILDQLGVDYITEQGQSGSWFYRKYKSGTAECWARINFAATTASGAVQSGFQFPFAFSSAPVVAITCGVSGRNDAYLRYVETNTTRVDCYINKNTDQNLARWLYCFAVGKVN